jgi:3-oxoacyl-(acyl-carrier-protein) synthase
LTGRAVVTGIGCVSPAGIGGKGVALALSDPSRAVPEFRVPDFSLEDHIGNARLFRRVAPATRFALAAVSLAVRDAGLPVGPDGLSRTAVVIGATHGAIAFSTQFFGEYLQDGPEGASPMLFSESVLNAPAGNVAIAFGVRGPVHTLIGEETVGAQALSTALLLLRCGIADRCIVAGTEERGTIIEYAYLQMDRAARRSGVDGGPSPQQGEGAAALVIESPEAAERRGAALRVPVLSCRCARDPRRDVETTVTGMVGLELATFREGAGDISHIVLPTGRNREPAVRGALRAIGNRAGDVRRIDIAPRVGNPFGAAAFFQMAASAAILASGNPRGRGLVLTSGIAGSCSLIGFGRCLAGGQENTR